MSLADIGFEHALRVPQSPEMLVEENQDLADFLNQLNRPIGVLEPNVVARYVIAASITEDHREIMDRVSFAATQYDKFDQIKKFRTLARVSFTDHGDRTFSLVDPHPVNSDKEHHARTIISVEGRFLFAHHQLFKDCATPEHFVHTIRNVEPLDDLEVDQFTVFGRLFKDQAA